MEYLLIGSLLGSIITSEHKDREACEGRAVLLRERQANVQCIAKSSGFVTKGGTMLFELCPQGTSNGVCYYSR